MRYLISLVLLITQADLYNAECNVACKKENYDAGKFSKGKCFCVHVYDYEYLTQGKNPFVTRKTALTSPPQSSPVVE